MATSAERACRRKDDADECHHELSSSSLPRRVSMRARMRSLRS
jgi:hypothetical protein